MYISCNRKFKTIIKNEKGMTLVEIVLSITLLAIVAVSFSLVFSNGYKFIFESGDKTEALAKASSAMENFYSADLSNLTNVPTELPALAVKNFQKPCSARYANDINDLKTYTPGVDMKVLMTNMSIVPGVNDYKVDVVVFYRNGQYVSLNAFFKAGG